MADKDRIINREDAKNIIKAIDNIANDYPKYVKKPTLKQDLIYYEGKPVNIIDYLNDFDSSLMFIFGDIEASYVSKNTITFQLKSQENLWIDGSSAPITYEWYLGYNINNIDDTSWETASDETIDTILSMAEIGYIDLENDFGWAIGDKRVIYTSPIEAGDNNNSYDSQWATLVLVAKDHYELETPNNGNDKNLFVVQFEHCLYSSNGRERIATENYIGWSKTRLRKGLNYAVINVLPDYIKKHMKSFKVYSPYYNGGEQLDISYDKLSIFGAYEIFYSWVASSYILPSEKEYTTYMQGANTILKKNVADPKNTDISSGQVRYWTRSIRNNAYTSYVIYQDQSNNNINSTSISDGCSISPFFCI